jgi:hypothetical protein
MSNSGIYLEILFGHLEFLIKNLIVLLIQQLKALELWYFNSTGISVKSLGCFCTQLFIFGKFFGACLESEWRFERRALYLDSLGTKHVLTSLVHARIFHHFHDISSLPESAIHVPSRVGTPLKVALRWLGRNSPYTCTLEVELQSSNKEPMCGLVRLPPLKSPTQKYE